MNAKSVFEKLVGIAHGYSWRLMSSLGSKKVNFGKPGEMLDRLTSEEREELKNLTSKDISLPDRQALAYMEGMYPNVTNVTVHHHSVKKDDES